MDASLIALTSLAEGVTWQGLTWFLIRVTVILASGYMALAVLTKRAAAATLHLVALVALVAPLAMPFANLVLPAGPTIVVPSRVASAMPALTRLTTTAPTVSVSPSRANHLVPAAVESQATSVSRFEVRATSVESALLALAEPPWSVVFACLVTGIALGLLVRVVVDVAAARELSRDATPIGDAAVQADLERARERLSIRRPILVLTSRRVAIPVVVGLLRPVVLLPPDALTWSPERRHAILTHELAHVGRHDGLALLFVRIATALLWFHPLAWMLARIARRESERACDDIVLAAGVRASEYADHLVDIARRASQHGFTPGLIPAFARHTSLESRLHALLRHAAPRGPANRRTIAFIVLGFLALMILIPVTSPRVEAAPATDASLVQVDSHDNNHEPVRVASSEPVHDQGSPPLQGGSEFREAHRSAVARYRELDDTRSERAAEWRLVGHALLDAGEPTLAADAFKRDYELSHCPSALYNLGCALALSGQTERALLMLERAESAGIEAWEKARDDPDLASIRSRIAARGSEAPQGRP